MTEPGSPDTPLSEWREAMQPRLLRLQAFEMPPGFPLDFSPASLDALEAQLLIRGSRESLTDAATGYLGEALMHTAGGRWGWDDAHDVPVVHLDADLDLAPIAPRSLIVEAGQRRSGHEFVRAQTALRQAVDARRARVAGWRPTKEPTPGLDDVLEVRGSDFLQVWLPQRERAFPQWIVDHAPGTGPWDFSAASLDLLESVVRNALPSPDDFDRPENEDLIEGAGWYLGEVLRRAGHAEWTYNPGEINPENMFVGRPYVKQMVQNGQSTVPVYALRNTVLAAEPGFLRERLSRFHDTYRRAQARHRAKS